MHLKVKIMIPGLPTENIMRVMITITIMIVIIRIATSTKLTIIMK